MIFKIYKFNSEPYFYVINYYYMVFKIKLDKLKKKE